MSAFLKKNFVAVIGVATLLIAALSALAQRDIKRVLAYSTISQIGYMFLALGVGASAAAMFPPLPHARFPALLFLGAGAALLIIERSPTRDVGQRRLDDLAALLGEVPEHGERAVHEDDVVLGGLRVDLLEVLQDVDLLLDGGHAVVAAQEQVPVVVVGRQGGVDGRDLLVQFPQEALLHGVAEGAVVVAHLVGDAELGDEQVVVLPLAQFAHQDLVDLLVVAADRTSRHLATLAH